MHLQARNLDVLIRAAEPGDDDYILGLVPRFIGFDLPPGRRRHVVVDGIGRHLARHLDETQPGSYLFVAEDDDRAQRVGFIHLLLSADFYSGRPICHVSEMAVGSGLDGRGIGRALLQFAEHFAREHRCERLTLNVFPGNTRALKLYTDTGYVTDLLRLSKSL